MIQHKDFTNEHSSCWISLFQGKYILYGVRTDEGHTKEGHASKLLEEVKNFCKEQNVPVKLYVKKFYHQEKNDNELIRWYAKNGFKVSNLYDKDKIWMEAS